jgi:hypothetical protein
LPYNQVLEKWAAGELHSGSKTGPKVKSHAQAVAIMLSEKKKAKAGNSEYAATGADKLGQGAKFK